MAINNTITITGVDPATGVKHTVRGTGATRAQALAELQARAALEVLVKQKGTESMAMAPADYAATTFATGAFADAELTLTKGIGFTDKVLRLPNTTTAVLLAGSKGQIDIANSLITDLASAYVDGDGVTGYIPLRGQFTE
jgi:hypothetical protein